MSVNGAEEDGVDNRVEAPSRVPGDGSEDTSTAEDSAGVSSPAAADSPVQSASAQATSAQATPALSASAQPTSAQATPAQATPAKSASAQATSAKAAGKPATTGSVGAPTQPAPTFIPAAQAATSGSASPSETSPTTVSGGAANGARGLATKVGSSFSGLTKPKPKPKAGPVRKSRPGQGLPPRPQQPAAQQTSSQPSRSAMLNLQRIEPISVLKFSSLISLICWVILFVAITVIYFTLSKLGVFAKIEDTVGLVTANKAHAGADAASWFSASRVLEYTAIVCTVNAVLFTALATVGAALYNLVTALTGGVEVTLKESD